jgi:hypothetical protein
MGRFMLTVALSMNAPVVLLVAVYDIEPVRERGPVLTVRLPEYTTVSLVNVCVVCGIV